MCITEEFKDQFKEITGFEAYKHQIKVIEALQKGKSVLLRAPTGSGKTEAAIVAFLIGKGKILPSQLIYSLPLRTLVDDVGMRVKKYLSKTKIPIAIHHGERVESPLFYFPIIITTIDQTTGAYACVPLSAPLRHGNIPAGAVSSALLVFDEIHTLEPELAMQSMLVLIRHSYKIGLPFVLMSATIPDTFIKGLQKEFKDIEIVIAEENDIPYRKNRNVELYWKDKMLESTDIISAYQKAKNIIVVCNTVDKAQQLFRSIKHLKCQKFLLHSRFLQKDRNRIETELKKIFNPESPQRGILISTQVIEVGLDISTNLMLTELSPIDSLIQRAGRCARRGGFGKIIVYNVEKPPPYPKKIINNTKREVCKYKTKSLRLNWYTEQNLVNKILGKYAKNWISPKNFATILNQISEAAFEGNRQLIEKSVRDIFSCEVAIHNQPESLGDKIYQLEKVKINLGILYSALKDWKERSEEYPVWKIEDNNLIFDEGPHLKVQRIDSIDEIQIGGFYILDTKFASYDKEMGLVFCPGKVIFKLEEKVQREKTDVQHKKEFWLEHALKTLEVFNTKIINDYKLVIEKFAEAWEIKFDDLVEKIKFVVAYHDIGKLNKFWQEKIGRNFNEEPLAHSDSNILDLPPHAPVSAYILSRIFESWNYDLGKAFYFAVAHHHSVRARHLEKFELIEDWKKWIQNNKLPKIDVALIIPEGQGKLEKFSEIINHEKRYRTYTIVSRILKFADWISRGGEDAILHYEKQYGNV